MLRPVRYSVAVQTQFVHLECAEINTNGLPLLDLSRCHHVTIPHTGVWGLAAVLNGEERMLDKIPAFVRLHRLDVCSHRS